MHFFISSWISARFSLFLHAALEVQPSIDKSTAKRNDNSFAERKLKKNVISVEASMAPWDMSMKNDLRQLFGPRLKTNENRSNKNHQKPVPICSNSSQSSTVCMMRFRAVTFPPGTGDLSRLRVQSTVPDRAPHIVIPEPWNHKTTSAITAIYG